MKSSALLLVVFTAASGVVLLGQRAVPAPPRPAPAPHSGAAVRPVPALSAEAEMKTFHLQPGYRVQLVAKEPLVRDPIAMDFDADGRLFVLEMPGFAWNKEMADSREPIGRVVMLEDTNDDGVMDKRTVFVDGLVLPRALKVLEHGVLVGEPPNLWLAQDTDGDGKADKKDLIRGDFGRADGNLEHNANSLYWGLDNWIYTAEHDWYLRLKHGTFEVARTLTRGQWGVTMDDGGRIYRNFNTEPLFADIVPARYYVRNPHLVRTRGLYERLVDPDKTQIWPARPTRGINRGYREGLLRPDGTAAYYAGASSPLIYRGDRLPSELSGNAFIVDSPTNLVHRLIVKDDGVGRLSAQDAYEKGEFLASTDERFRPVNLSSGPDGTLYIVDMYRGVVQDAQFQTEYLRDYIVQRGLELPVAKGRIFRVVHESTRRDRTPRLSKETPAALVSYLSHPNGWWRDTAQRLLVERGDTSVAPALATLAREAPDARARLHALWTLDGLDAIEPASVLRALNDPSPDVRASALRLAERWFGERSDPGGSLRDAVLTKLDDPNWLVRRQLAASLGELPGEMRIEPLALMLERFGDDPMVVDAAISGLGDREAIVLTRLLDARQAKTDLPRREDAIAMLAAAATRAGDGAPIQQMLAAATDATRPESIRLALLSGVETGLSASIETASGNRGAVPAGATGRAAMAGGAVAGAANGNRPPSPNGRSQPRLSAEPVALTQLASGTGEAAALARQILSRISWPGKPVPVGPVIPPLTAAEQARFTAGSEIYKNICINCHQPDGRGKEKLAPALIGSKYVLAMPAVPARILLGGKEGTVGLMPPLAMLTDDQIAAVLTYVRREWGNTGSPVNPAIIKDVRAVTASHTRPWTDAELAKFLAVRPN